MSGTSFLEEIVNWDAEKRAEKVEEALPRLIICLENHSSIEEANGVLQILCHSFVPMVEVENLEQKVFSRLSQQVCQLLDDVMEELHKSDDEETDREHLTDMLQHVVCIVQCVEECVKHMLGLSDLHAWHVRSLMHCTFHVLKGSYRHCRESSGLYGDDLPALSESLSSVFRAAHSLQMSLLNLMEKLSKPSADEHSVQDVANMCEGLFALCRLVACLDLKLTISLWKALSKLAGSQADVYHQHIDMPGMVGYLCEEIGSGVTQLIQSAPPAQEQDEMMLSQGDEKTFLKSLRILNFQMKVLVALVRDFHSYLGDSVPSLVKLLLDLNSLVPPCLCAPRLREKHESEVRQQLTNATQPVAAHLLPHATFLRCVLDATDVVERTQCSHLLLQVTVMDAVAQAAGDTIALWMDNSPPSSGSDRRPNLLSAVFTSLDACHVEVCLPVYLLGAPCQGQQERKLSLYQYVLEHLCAFLASVPARLFHVVETELLAALLDSNPISSQAAADSWCFIARYGTAALCWHHTQRVLSLVLQAHSLAPLSSALACPLVALLRRLVKFLTPQHQRELLTMVPMESRASLWMGVGVSAVAGEVVGAVTQVLVQGCLSALTHLNAAGSPPSLREAAAVIPPLRCLHDILSNDTAASHISAQQGAQLLDLLLGLWRVVPPDVLASGPTGEESGVKERYLSALVTVLSDLLVQLDAKLLLKVVTVCADAIESRLSVLRPPLSHAGPGVVCRSIQVVTVCEQMLSNPASHHDLRSAPLCLMQSLGPLRVPPAFEQGQILRKMGELFSSGLTHTRAAVQYASLEAFTHFAQHTAHEAVVPQCLARHPALQDKVAAYLTKVPYPQGHQFDEQQYLQEQREKWDAVVHNMSRTERSTPTDAASNPEPQSKRQRLDNTSCPPDQPSDGYADVLSELERVVLRLEQLRGDGAVPDSVVTTARPLLQRLSQCLK